MELIRKNFARGILASTVSVGASSLTVQASHSLPTEAGNFYLTIWDASNYPDPHDDPGLEIVLAEYSGTPNIYNITRAQEDTSAVEHYAGNRVALHFTAATAENDLLMIGQVEVNEADLAEGKILEIYDDSGTLKFRYVSQSDVNISKRYIEVLG